MLDMIEWQIREAEENMGGSGKCIDFPGRDCEHTALYQGVFKSNRLKAKSQP